MKKVTVILLTGLICLLGVTALAYNEAPMLKTMVAAGELPPVEERLPKNPMVVKVLNEIGTYGGTIRFAEMGWLVDIFAANVEPLVTGEPSFSDNIIPNLVEKVETSPDATTFTFRMREGLKWSDGVPVTTDDVLFKWEDVLLNETLSPVFPSSLQIEGERATLEVIDKYTFRIKFPSSYGSYLPYLSWLFSDYGGYMLPKHYLKRFHIKYTPLEDLEPLIKEEGYGKGEWWKLFNRKVSGLNIWDVNVDIGAPTLRPWMIEKKISAKIKTFVRNPYYWKVDEAGNQLPYTDRIQSELFSEPDIILSKIMAGEVDLVPEMAKFSDLPMLKQYAERGGYKTMVFGNNMGTWVTYFFNYTYDEDSTLREIINDDRFRQALSLAIDRETICDIIFLGFADPVQTTLLGTKYTEPSTRESYAEYDPENANKLLDEMGLKRGSDGIRRRPDGKNLALPIEFFEMNPYVLPVTEMVVQYWRDIGIDVSMKLITGTLWNQNHVANKTLVSVWHDDGATDLDFRFLAGNWYTPSGRAFGYKWNRWWVTNGQEGEEPPELIKQLIEWGDILKFSMDEEEVLNAGKQLVRSQAEHVWRIGVGSTPVICIIKEGLGNMPEKSPDPTVLTMSTVYDLEQAFWKK